MTDLSVYCADIGSIAATRFGWFGQPVEGQGERGTSIEDLVARVAQDLTRRAPVALGFECPLFVPVSDDPMALSLARPGEGSRPWSAHAGAGALVIGLSQVVWILRRLRAVDSESSAFVAWEPFRASGVGLFLWEAFVSGKAKRDGHPADAQAAVEAFLQSLPEPFNSNAIRSPDVHSLVGAALLRTGWSADVGLLSQPCLVIRAMLPGAA